MKRILLLALVLAGAVCAQAQADDQNPGSLWPQKYSNPLVDRTARHEGDLLTIIISENSQATYSATTTTARSEKGDIGNLNVPVLTGLFKALGINNSSSTSGTGSTTQSGVLTARLTAVVKQVLPNGNLVVEGQRMVKVNKDWQLISLTGIVRRDDIRADNTVLSENIANAEIKTDGKGQISSKQKRGWLTRILDAIF